MRSTSMSLATLALLAACAAPPAKDEPPRTLADVSECTTGSNLCRRDRSASNVQTTSGAGAREALDRMRPTGTQPISSGSSR
jgi:hypothetical protein